MIELLTKTLMQVVVTFAHTWPYLALSVLIAAVLKVHVRGQRRSAEQASLRGLQQRVAQ